MSHRTIGVETRCFYSLTMRKKLNNFSTLVISKGQCLKQLFATIALVLVSTSCALKVYPVIKTNEQTATEIFGHGLLSHTTTKLSNDSFVIVGGIEKYDYSLNKFAVIGHLQVGRFIHRTVAIDMDRILIAGGFDGNHSLASLEVFESRPSMKLRKDSHTASLLYNSFLFIAGGL